jgi:DNA-binding CsgD family transcriptional regulator
MAALAAVRGEACRAAQLGGAAAQLRQRVGAPPPPAYSPLLERYQATARARLDAAGWAAAWVAGAALSPERAVALALAPAPGPPDPGGASTAAAAPPAHPGRLTAREVEVLRLVAEGLTDPQVAARLSLSPRTVNQHLRSVYTKLGVASRAAAARFAAEHHLL